MKSKSILRLFIAIAITIFATVGQLFAQGNNYKLDGNNNGNAHPKLIPTKNKTTIPVKRPEDKELTQKKENTPAANIK